MTLFEIIEAVKRNERPEYDEIRYALLALDALNTFTSSDLHRFSSRAPKRLTPSMGDVWIEEDFRRTRQALQRPPKDWLGWDYDPENPEYRDRRKRALGLLDRVSRDAEPKP